MASYNPPVKNAEYIFYISLFAQSDNQVKTTPTIAAGDFKVSTDGGATSNLDTLPSESPASSGNVKITVSATEMNGDNISVIWIDAAGDEWHSGMTNIQPVASGQQFDDLSTADGVWDEVMDTDAPANAQTAREHLRLFAAVLLGKTNDGTGSQFIARDPGDTTDRVTADIDGAGYRTSVTLDGAQ